MRLSDDLGTKYITMYSGNAKSVLEAVTEHLLGRQGPGKAGQSYRC